MSVTVRAKFRCNSIEDFGRDKKARLSPVTAYNGSSSDATDEDKAFWEATPSGHLELYVTNPTAAEYFDIGKYYYLDFEKCD